MFSPVRLINSSDLSTKDINNPNRDISRKPENDEYISLGNVVYYHDPKNPNGTVDPMLFACVKKSCCKKLESNKLRLMFIYPCSSPHNTNTNTNI